VIVLDFRIFLKIGVEDMSDPPIGLVTGKHLHMFAELCSGEELDKVGLFLQVIPTLTVGLLDETTQVFEVVFGPVSATLGDSHPELLGIVLFFHWRYFIIW
jgi:hypothetical protein